MNRTATMDARTAASTLEERLQEYRPESYHDFSDPETAERMRDAIAQVAGQLGREYPARVGGEDVRLDETRASTDPSRPSRVVGVFPAGGQGLADRAIDAANQAFATWKNVPASVSARASGTPAVTGRPCSAACSSRRQLPSGRRGSGTPAPGREEGQEISMKQILLFEAPAPFVTVSLPSLTVTVDVPSSHRVEDVGVPATVATPSTLRRNTLSQ